ncbi:MAG: hypothetical protein EP335_09890 [Alphaproteobacteria bacterium]|nr:MAG: hypothetical protein EP335_09890 [Alphaproteobacteria bacterium]
MKHEEESLEQDALRPRRGFLVASAVASLAAILAYLFREDVVRVSGGSEIAFAFLIGMLILLAMYLLLCYRVPRLGNRLLGFDVVLAKDSPTEKSSMQYTGSFQVQTGLAEKRLNTKRKQARYSRRKLAEVTRQMNADKAARKPDADPTDEKTD